MFSLLLIIYCLGVEADILQKLTARQGKSVFSVCLSVLGLGLIVIKVRHECGWFLTANSS